MRKLTPIVLGLGLAAMLACGGEAPQGAGDRKSVLLVTIDTLRADHVGAYGASWAKTPTLDRLAASGVRVETAVAPTPLTLPSHASILTGLYPPHHGVRYNGIFRLPEDGPGTLAERFQEAGWQTGAVVGAVVLAERYGLDRGFDHYDDGAGAGRSGPSGYAERRAEAVTDRALEWVRAQEGEPFFLWVHYYDPHQSYRAPERFRRLLPERPYDAEIAYVDAHLGRLLDGLKREGRRSDTLVVATSDHGESLGEHGEPTHAYTLYDATQHVPLLLDGPDLPSGTVSDAIASVVDVAPTLLELAGLPALEEADGRSLAGRWGPDAGWKGRAVYAETKATQIEFGWAPLYAARSSRHLYVEAPQAELYDVVEDPDQTRNLLVEEGSAPPEGVTSRLAERIAAVREEAVRSTETELDRETREQIQSLGYALPEDEVAESGLDPKEGFKALPLLQAGIQAYTSGENERAIRLLERVLELAPRSARAHAHLGFAHLEAGRPETALPHAEASVQLNPRHAYYRAMWAETLLALGERETAFEQYEEIVELRPRSPWAHVARVWKALRAEDLERVDRYAKKAAQECEHSVPVCNKLGHLMITFGLERRAILAFRHVVRVRPDSAYAQMKLAILYAGVGEREKSREHRRRAGELEHDANLGRLLVLALSHGGDPGAAHALLQELRKEHPEDPKLRRLQERIAKEAGASPGRG